MRKGKGSKEKKIDEVEELLQAAQDQLLLNLSVNSHIASASSNNFLDSDLERRFQALKSTGSSSMAITSQDQESKAALGDDLSTRFAAIKTKLNHNHSSSSNQIPPRPDVYNNVEDENEADEVERLIQWARDAARLDPSPPSDDDEVEEHKQDDDDDDDDDDEEEDRSATKKKNQNLRKPK